MTHRDSIESRTAELYGSIFPLFRDEDFVSLQKTCLPEAFGLESGYYEGRRVLDLGCGGLGYAIAAFLKGGAREVVAVDVSSQNLERLKGIFNNEKDRVVFVQSDICDIRQDLGKFDLIHCCGVLHHTSDPEKAARLAYDMLLPGGVFISSLYGRGGIVTVGWDIMRLFRFILPEKATLNFLKRHWRFGAFYVMDYIFVPVLKRYSESAAKALFAGAGFADIERLKRIPTTKGMVRYLQQAQMDHEKFITKLLHGAGWIILKGKKSV